MRCPFSSRSVAGGLESMPVATCAMTPRRAPTSSCTMATRIAATRVPLVQRVVPENCGFVSLLRPQGPSNPLSRSPAHRPCASCRRQMRTGKRCQSLLSDARHRSRCTPHSSSRRVERHSVHLQPRDERSRLDSRPPHFSAFAPVAKGLRPRMCGAIPRAYFTYEQSGQPPKCALFW